jgi:hypothetical protein
LALNLTDWLWMACRMRVPSCSLNKLTGIPQLLIEPSLADGEYPLGGPAALMLPSRFPARSFRFAEGLPEGPASACRAPPL